MFSSKAPDAETLRGKILARKDPLRRLKALRALFALGMTKEREKEEGGAERGEGERERESERER
jgi:hypothetical protein